MEEIKVGDYIRTKDGEIDFIDHLENNTIKYTIGEIHNNVYIGKSRYIKRDITKHSFNIIDLIEEGDYVNGYMVIGIHKDRDGIQYIDIDTTNLLEGDIKSTVTKEQFKSIEYVTKEEK